LFDLSTIDSWACNDLFNSAKKIEKKEKPNLIEFMYRNQRGLLEKTEERPESNSHSYYDEDETTVFFKRTFGLHTNALFINSN